MMSCVDQVDPGWHRRQPAGPVLHAGDNVQGSARRQDAVRDRRFPGVRADERTDVRDTTVAQRTRPRLEGTTAANVCLCASSRLRNRCLVGRVFVALKRWENCVDFAEKLRWVAALSVSKATVVVFIDIIVFFIHHNRLHYIPTRPICYTYSGLSVCF